MNHIKLYSYSGAHDLELFVNSYYLFKIIYIWDISSCLVNLVNPCATSVITLLMHKLNIFNHRVRGKRHTVRI